MSLSLGRCRIGQANNRGRTKGATLAALVTLLAMQESDVQVGSSHWTGAGITTRTEPDNWLTTDSQVQPSTVQAEPVTEKQEIAVEEQRRLPRIAARNRVRPGDQELVHEFISNYVMPMDFCTT